MMAQHHYSFPVVTGIDSNDPLPSRKARMAVYQRLLGELDANGQRFSDQLSEIDLTDPEDARVLMPEQGADILAHFGEDHFLERYQRYKAHIGEWRQQYPKLAEVDLRYDQQVVLEMTPGGGASPAALNTGDGQPTTAEAQPSSKPALAKIDAATAAPTHQAAAIQKAGKMNAKPDPAKLAATNPAPAHPATAAQKVNKKATKPHANTSATKAEKARAERIKQDMAKQQKRAEAKRAALKRSRQKAAAKSHSTTTAGQSR